MPYRTFRNRNGYDLAANRKYIRCCSHGSIWKEPNDWMMGLKQKERTLVAFWDEETGADMSSTVAKQIEVVYGPSKVFDFLKYGSIWKEPNDWMMGLKQKERTLVAFWDDETGADMSSTVANIMLEANATSSSSGYLSLSYEFDNAQVAFDEREASESSVF